MSKHECSLFVVDDPPEEWANWQKLCRCPECKGFLPADFPQDKPFTCKKCKIELMAFDYFEDGEKIPYMGKICPIGDVR